jgi:uncharacterized protein (TIGR02246 family)
MNYHRLIVVGSLLLLAGVSTTVCADDAETIRNSANEFVAAFDKGDAKAVAQLWATDGKLIDAAGEVYCGRPEIEDAYAKFFAAHPGEKIEVSVDSVELLSDDAAIEEGTATLKTSPSDAASAGRYTAVHVKQDGKWRMAFVHESGAASLDEKETLQDLDWLVGKWTGEERGATADIVCSWLPNKSFLERQFTVTTPDHVTTSGLQLIGVNSQTGKIISWNFNSDGSHAVATWEQRPGGWAVDSIGLRTDGTETHAVNLLTKLDENAYAWQSISRSVAGMALPETDEVIIKREVPPKTAKK